VYSELNMLLESIILLKRTNTKCIVDFHCLDKSIFHHKLAVLRFAVFGSQVMMTIFSILILLEIWKCAQLTGNC